MDNGYSKNYQGTLKSGISSQKPDPQLIADSKRFLDFLGRSGNWQYFWQDPNTPPVWFPVGEVPQFPSWKSTYFNVHPAKNCLEGHKRGGLTNIAAINCLYAEFDQKDGWTLERVKTLKVPSSVIVSSGGGWHCYWLLYKPVKVTDDNINKLKYLQEKWVEMLQSDQGAKDLSRVLRVPGTYNNKPQYAPGRLVYFIKLDFELLYTLDELEEKIKLAFPPNIQKFILHPEGIFPGERNTTLTRIAGSLRREGYQEEEIFRNLDGINSSYCIPPLEEKEIRKIANSCSRYPTNSNKKQVQKPTDDELADRILQNVSGICYSLGGWRRYQNGVWVEFDKVSVDKEILEILEDAKDEGIRPTKQLIASVAEIAKLKVQVPNEKWDVNTEIVALNNGFFDLITRDFKEHSPDNFITSKLEFDFDPNTKAPNWQAFLESTVPEAMDFLQEFSGLCLTTDMQYEVAVWLLGPPGSGKSTFIEGLQAMLGNQTTILGFTEIEHSRFALSRLSGKNLVIGYEQPSGHLNSSFLLNAIISGETIVTERKFKDPVEIKTCCKYIAAMNTLPVLYNANDGLFRRVKVVKFPSLEEDKRDPSLKERIKKEGPGIFNWALEGLLRLRERKELLIPDSVLSATSEYKKHSDIPTEFISECCIVGPEKKIQSQILYNAYKGWCLNNGHKPLSSTLIAREWERVGFQKYSAAGKNYWRGVEIRKV